MDEKEKNDETSDRNEEKKEIKDEKKIKKKINWKRVLIVSAIILAIVILLIFLKHPKTSKKITIEKFNVSYSIYDENGSLIDSGGKILSLNEFSSEMNFVSDKINSEIALMKVGEEKTIVLNPEDAYGSYDKNKVFVENRTTKLNRNTNISRLFSISLDDFRRIFKKEPMENETYELRGYPWKFKVKNLDLTEKNITISREIEIGKEIPSGISNVKTIVKDLSEDKIFLFSSLEKENSEIVVEAGTIVLTSDSNFIYMTLNPKIGSVIEFNGILSRIVSFNETSFVLDGNNRYAGHKITIKVKLNGKIEETSNVKFEVFVMSYCPFGTQFEKALVPVYKLLKNEVDIKVRFVHYTMHGQKEETENFRQICIREEQKDKFWNYLECFLRAGNSNSCLNEAKIDLNKLKDCMNNRASDYYAVDSKLSKEYGVRGSPTPVLNGKKIEIWPRSPENIKEKICESFSEKPKECSTTLSKENPSAGFGYGTGGGSRGSC